MANIGQGVVDIMMTIVLVYSNIPIVNPYTCNALGEHPGFQSTKVRDLPEC